MTKLASVCVSVQLCVWRCVREKEIASLALHVCVCVCCWLSLPICIVFVCETADMREYIFASTVMFVCGLGEGEGGA
jgi:hypothetical protein